jgi:hypothetical protein
MLWFSYVLVDDQLMTAELGCTMLMTRTNQRRISTTRKWNSDQKSKQIPRYLHVTLCSEQFRVIRPRQLVAKSMRSSNAAISIVLVDDFSFVVQQ